MMASKLVVGTWLVACIFVANTMAVTVQLTDAQKTELLDAHNHYRRLEGASDMSKLSWNADLAEMAQEFADGCSGDHGQPARDPMPFGNIGQNIYSSSGTVTNMTNVVWKWFEEKKYYFYDYSACATGKDCGHYTQVVWATTTDVGCGMVSGCPGSYPNHMYCNYGPAGNEQYKSPYKKGTACSKCNTGIGWCENGLCKSKCTSANSACSCNMECKNCGTLTTDKCTCSCADGWHGTDCSVQCKDYDDYCGGNPGWPASWCDKSFVKSKCFVLCGLCVPSTSPATC